MEVTQAKMLYLVCLLTILGLLVSQHDARSSSTGLTIELIHSTSPDSPFNIANLTRIESVQRLLSQSMARARARARARALQNRYEGNNLTQILRVQPEVHTEQIGPLIMMKVNLGTFQLLTPPYKSYNLHIDTGSELIWLQCEDCLQKGNNCFYHTGEPPFPNSRSRSYHPLPCNRHDLCHPGKCDQDFCSYHVEYEDGLQTSGILATEAFTFRSSAGNTETVPGLVFGCGTNNIDPSRSTTGKEAGILGLGWGSRSFVSQLKYQNNEKFSYCFPHWDPRGARSYLKFGADIVQEEGFHSTALRKVGTERHYYLNLEGISIAGMRLGIPRPMFAVRGDGSGGTIIDTGTTLTYLVTGAYEQVKGALKTHFKNLRNYKLLRRTSIQYDLCFERVTPRRDALPWITFHFIGGADLVITPENAFVKVNDHGNEFCLAMFPHDDSTTLGSYQQSNILPPSLNLLG